MDNASTNNVRLRDVTDDDLSIYARATKDNLASLRVLEKCGFTVTGYERGFAKARGAEIDEVILKLG